MLGGGDATTGSGLSEGRRRKSARGEGFQEFEKRTFDNSKSLKHSLGAVDEGESDALKGQRQREKVSSEKKEAARWNPTTSSQGRGGGINERKLGEALP